MSFRQQHHERIFEKMLRHSIELLLVFVCLSWQIASLRAQDNSLAFFESSVRPILAEHCYACHSGRAERLEGGLRLDHGSLMRSGGDSGAALVPGNPAESLMLQAVKHEGLEMPPSGPLSIVQVDVLERWIQAGAEWPVEDVPEVAKEAKPFDLLERQQSHWAWKPRSRVPTPNNKEDAWSGSMIDCYVAEKLREHKLAPAARAERVTIVRRLYLDLIGLPPTEDSLASHVRNESLAWYAELVDELLADPQFGVRFGRHWLDLVRYANSRGHEFDEDASGAEHYRDYVVRALNADVPYDTFVREHIAGDLMEPPRVHPTRGWSESVLGTGFWHLGEWVHSPVDIRKDETDRFDNMVDVFSKSFLGLTVSCARCHDHKFDAISSEDYYGLFGYLQSSHYRMVRFETEAKDREIAIELEGIRQKHQATISAILDREEYNPLRSVARLDPENGQESNRNEGLEFRLEPLAVSDPAVLFDPRNLASTQWHSNGPGFGNRPVLAGELRLVDDGNGDGNGNGDAKGPRLKRNPLAEIASDPFWNSLRNRGPQPINVKNSNAQIREAGRTFLTPTFVLASSKISLLVRGNCRVHLSIDSHRLIAGPLHGELVKEYGSEEKSYRWITIPSLERYQGKSVHLEFSPTKTLDCGLVQIVDGEPPPTPTKKATESISSTLVFDAAGRPDLAAAIDSWANDERTLAQRVEWESRVAIAMIDGDGQNERLLIRGNHERPSQEVPRRFLEALGGKRSSPEINSAHGSGRLALAEQVSAPENPLTARVISNRIWHHLIGRGIVPTPDDFGIQGQAPTHPELLDALANDLVDGNWSIKRLVRAICLSETYRMSSVRSEDAAKLDPTNDWLSHARVRRLEAESIRDSMMAITGQLDLRLEGGTSPVHLTDFLQGRGRPAESGPANGHGRRSMYLEVRRNFLNPMLSAFDMPTPFSAMGRRNVSNVPAQSLTLLNDPWLHQLADQWADRIVTKEASDERRLEMMYTSALGRTPTSTERTASLDFIASTNSTTLNSWRSLAHVLINSKELIYRR